MLPIVIVDDSREDLALAERVLRQCGILNPVRSFASGAESIRYFDGQDQYADRELPCLLLVDLIMSPVSGVDVLRNLAANKAAEGSIAIMLSGLQDIKAIREGYQSGAATFFLKPLNCEDLIHLVRSVRGLALESSPEGHVLSLAARSEAGGNILSASA